MISPVSLQKGIKVNIILRIIVVSLNLLLFALASAPAVCADSLDRIQIIKISARDKQAIVKMDDGKMRIIKVGEDIAVQPDDQAVPDAKDQKQSPAEKQTPEKDQKAAVNTKESKARLKAGKTKADQEKTVKAEDRAAGVKKEAAAGRKATVTEISAGLIVLEEKTKSGPETIILRLEQKEEKTAKNTLQKDRGQVPENKTIVERIRKRPDTQGTGLLKKQESGKPDVKLPDKGMTGKDDKQKKE